MFRVPISCPGKGVLRQASARLTRKSARAYRMHGRLTSVRIAPIAPLPPPIENRAPRRVPGGSGTISGHDVECALVGVLTGFVILTRFRRRFPPTGAPRSLPPARRNSTRSLPNAVSASTPG